MAIKTLKDISALPDNAQQRLLALANAEAEKQALEDAKAARFPIVVEIVIAAASGNLYDRQPVRNGILYGTLAGVKQSGDITYECADGEVATESIKDWINSTIAINIGVDACEEFAETFHEVQPNAQTGSRAVQFEFRMKEIVHINGEGTLIVEGEVFGGLGAPKGQKIASKEMAAKKRDERRAKSAEIRESSRKKLMAMLSNDAPNTSVDESETEPETNESETLTGADIV